jgi:YD repeat-containing protein
VIDQTLLDGRHFEVDYQPNKTTITVTGADGHQEVREFRYDQSETLTGTSINGLSQSASDFEAHFAPGSITDANDHTTSAVYNDTGQPITVTNALGQTTLMAYDSQNHPITVTDTLGRQTVSVYDTHNNLVRQTTGITTALPLGFTTIFTYTTDNRLQERRGPDGVVTRYDYDAVLGQVLGTTVGYGTPLAQTTAYAYDQFGRVVTTFLGANTPEARVEVTRYNADNTIAEVIHNYENGVFEPDRPDEDIGTTYGYDQLGRMVAITDTLGHVDLTHYDDQGRVDWTARNAVPAQFDSHGLPVYHAYDAAQPDANVATLYGLDGLGRTVLVTQTGILTGTFDPATLQFNQAAERVRLLEQTCHHHLELPARPAPRRRQERPGADPLRRGRQRRRAARRARPLDGDRL